MRISRSALTGFRHRDVRSDGGTTKMKCEIKLPDGTVIEQDGWDRYIKDGKLCVPGIQKGVEFRFISGTFGYTGIRDIINCEQPDPKQCSVRKSLEDSESDS